MDKLIGLLITGALLSPAFAADKPQPMPRLVYPEEIAAVEARLMARIGANKVRRCERPVLGAPGISGSDRELVAALVEGAGAGDPCAEQAEVLKDLLGSKNMDAWRQDPSKIPPEVRDGINTCEALNVQVREAVARRDVCSPYQPGIRPVPAFFGFLRRGKLAILSARVGFDSSQSRDTVVTVLSWARLTQDLYRGGGPLLPAMVGTALFESNVTPTLRWIIEEGGLDASALRVLAADIGNLLDTEPAVGPVLSNDPDVMMLQVVLPALKGPDYVPPGGWEDGYGLARDGNGMGGQLGEKVFVSKELEAALLAVAIDEIGSEQRQACPNDASIIECRTGLLKIAEARMAEAQGLSGWRIAFRILASGDAVREIRETIIDILASIAAPAFHRYIDRIAERSFLLAALRVQVMVLAAQAADGLCTVPEAMTGESWSPVLEDPIFGGRLKVTRMAGTGAGEALGTDIGFYRIVPAAWFDSAASTEPWSYEFRCAESG